MTIPTGRSRTLRCTHCVADFAFTFLSLRLHWTRMAWVILALVGLRSPMIAQESSPLNATLALSANFREAVYEVEVQGQKVTITNWHPVAVAEHGAPAFQRVAYDQSTERGPHHRIHRTVRDAVLPDGQRLAITNQYVQLGSGLHYLENDQWRETEEVFEVFPEGAVARKGPHKVVIDGNAATRGAIDLETPDGKRLRSHVLGLSYNDVSSGLSVLIAEVKPCEGRLHPPNQVVFSDAFTDFKADLRYTYTKGGFEQDVIFRENPPSPSDYGLDPRFSRLEVLTEFLEPPVPRVTYKKLGSVAGVPEGPEAELHDEDLDFGVMRMGSGRAFWLGEDRWDPMGSAASPRVLKHWNVVEGRSVLFEAVDYLSVKSQLEKLPRAKGIVDPEALVRGDRQKLLAQCHRSVQSRRPVQLAQAGVDSGGFVLDYQILSCASNVTFHGGTTYWVQDPVYLQGTTTFEGGCVIKYGKYTSPTGYVWIALYGPTLCQTDVYRPLVLTAKDDDSVGEVIDGSTGSPSGYYGYYGLAYRFASDTLAHVRAQHLYVPFSFYFGTNYVLQHAQSANSHLAIEAHGAEVRIRNMLIRDTGAVFYGPAPGQSYASAAYFEHLTVKGATCLLGASSGCAAPHFTNSIFAGVTNTQGAVGSFNATNASAAEVFQTIGGGTAYLKPGSPYRNAGTSDLEASLLKDLRARTTYPPLLVSGQMNVNTTLAPVVPCDTDAPDLGYHYPRVDYLVSDVQIGGASLTLTNGVVVARGVSSNLSSGIQLSAGGRLLSGGLADRPNRLLSYLTVQETPQASTDSDYLVGGGADAELRFRFTELGFLKSGADSVYVSASSGVSTTVEFRDCSFMGGGIYVGQSPVECDLVNCSFMDEARVLVNSVDRFACFNATFVKGLFIQITQGSGTYIARDSLFDKTDVRLVNQGGSLDFGYNGYVAGYGSLGTSCVELAASPAYEAGPLGGHYLPAANPLVNAGSRLASSAGLFHYTTTATQAKEGSSTVDIGFHYVSWEPRDGLVGHWRLDEGTGSSVGDASGSGHVGALVNGPVWTAAQSGAGLDFDGVDDSVTVAESSALRLPGEMTIALWMRADAGAGDWMRLVGKGAGGVRNYGLWMDGGSSRHLLFQQYREDTGYYLNLLSSSQVALGSWHHGVATVEAGVSRLYVDGVLESLTSIAQNAGTSDDPVTFAYAGYCAPYAGVLDDLRVYNRALTLVEIGALNAKVFFDSDGDQLPDYVEDWNGNGVSDPGESDWQSALSTSGGLSVYRPSPPSVLP